MTLSNTKPVHVTLKSFEAEVTESPIPVVVDFWAPWCGPCKAIAPLLDKLATEYAGRVKVVKVNVDEEGELAGGFNVRSIPTLAAMQGREVVDVQVGFGGQKSIEKLFSKLAAQKTQAAASA